MIAPGAARTSSKLEAERPSIEVPGRADRGINVVVAGDMSEREMSGMMAMMNDPEMRAEMMEMMRNCNEMMKKKREQMAQGEAG